jgi:serine/threonine protein kinase/tetratricopeptide (TPR) repeat protein
VLGETVSHYRILEKLGQGGMGEVYLAEDTRLGREVALKFLAPELARDRDALARFRTEAKAAAELSHPNIATIYDIGETPERPYLVLEYLRGQSLRARIKKGPLPIEEALRVGGALAEGLAAAHSHGIVHRDVKSANIMLGDDGSVKILDFGLARLADATQLTKPGTTLGTIFYMSPEQALGRTADERSDIWSLGIVLYECLTGRLPFRGDSGSVLAQVQSADPDPPTAVRTGIPMDLERVVLRCLQRDPQLRHQHADDLVAELRNLGHQLSVDRTVTLSKDGPDSASRRKTWTGVVTGVAVIVFGVAAYMLGTRKPPPDQSEPQAIAIVEFRNLGSPEGEQVRASMIEFINISLVENSPIRVVSPEYLRDIRRRLFGTGRGPIAEDEVLTVAREAGAALLLTGGVGRIENKPYVTWRVVDTNSGQNVAARRIQGQELSAVVDSLVYGVVAVISEVYGLVTPPEPIRPVTQITTSSPRAYQHFVSGRLALEENDASGAQNAFERAIQLDPDFALAHLELGMFYGGHWMQYRDPRRQGELLDRARELDVHLGQRDHLRLAAALHDHDRHYSLAVENYEAILSRWPDDREALIDLKNLVERFWDTGRSLALSRQGLDYYPDDIAIFGTSVVNALRALGNEEDALRLAQEYVRRQPQNANAWDDLAWAWLAVGRPDSAEVAALRTLTLDPQFGQGGTLPLCAFAAGDIQRAITLTEAYLDNDWLTDRARSWRMRNMTTEFSLAGLLLESGQHQEALEVMDSGADGLASAFPMAVFLARTGRPAEVPDAVRDFPRVRARAALASGDVEGAKEAAERLRSGRNREGMLPVRLALKTEAGIALMERDPAAAVAATDTLIGLGTDVFSPIGLEIFTVRATAFRSMGKLDEAAAVHKKILSLLAGHALSRFELAQIYEEMGRPDDARVEYAKFLEMWANADEGLPQLVTARTRLAALGSGR